MSYTFLQSIDIQREYGGMRALMATVKNLQPEFGTKVKHFTIIDMETRLNISGSKVARFGEVHSLQFVPL